jgi:hypothetical protein
MRFLDIKHLYPALEMLVFVPIMAKDPDASQRECLENNSGDLNMLGTIARWGHNTLLIAMALMTIALFVLAR